MYKEIEGRHLMSDCTHRYTQKSSYLQLIKSTKYCSWSHRISMQVSQLRQYLNQQLCIQWYNCMSLGNVRLIVVLCFSDQLCRNSDNHKWIRSGLCPDRVCTGTQRHCPMYCTTMLNCTYQHNYDTLQTCKYYVWLQPISHSTGQMTWNAPNIQGLPASRVLVDLNLHQSAPLPLYSILIGSHRGLANKTTPQRRSLRIPSACAVKLKVHYSDSQY